MSVQYSDQAEAKPTLRARVLKGLWVAFCWALAFGSVLIVSLMAVR